MNCTGRRPAIRAPILSAVTGGNAGKARFTTTRWSVVQAAAAGDAAEADQALAALCASYWYPLYVYLRRRGHDADDAEDLTQAFFVRLIEKRALRHADPARGRFRSFLLAALKHFTVNEWERERAQKRGGGSPPLSLDFERAEHWFQREPSTNETPERLFDRAWALTLLDHAMTRLRADLERSGRSDQIERLTGYLMDDQPHRYADTARELGMSEGAVRVAVHRLRRHFRDLVRQEIAQTVSSSGELDDELRHLLRAVAK